MALFNKIDNETEAEEAINVGFIGGMITALLCIPAIIGSLNSYFGSTSRYYLTPDLYLYPYLYEIILFFIIAGTSLLFRAKKQVWILGLLAILTLLRLYVVHGINGKPYSFGLFISFGAFIFFAEGLRGIKAFNRLKKTPIKPNEIKRFDSDEYESSQRVRLASYGGFAISGYLFISIFVVIFSGIMPQLIASVGIGIFITGIVLLSLFCIGFAYLSWKIAVRQDIVSAVILLVLFSTYVIFITFMRIISSSLDLFSIIFHTIIMGLLLIGLIAAIKHNKTYKQKN